MAESATNSAADGELAADAQQDQSATNEPTGTTEQQNSQQSSESNAAESEQQGATTDEQTTTTATNEQTTTDQQQEQETAGNDEQEGDDDDDDADDTFGGGIAAVVKQEPHDEEIEGGTRKRKRVICDDEEEEGGEEGEESQTGASTEDGQPPVRVEVTTTNIPITLSTLKSGTRVKVVCRKPVELPTSTEGLTSEQLSQHYALALQRLQAETNTTAKLRGQLKEYEKSFRDQDSTIDSLRRDAKAKRKSPRTKRRSYLNATRTMQYKMQNQLIDMLIDPDGLCLEEDVYQLLIDTISNANDKESLVELLTVAGPANTAKWFNASLAAIGNRKKHQRRPQVVSYMDEVPPTPGPVVASVVEDMAAERTQQNGQEGDDDNAAAGGGEQQTTDNTEQAAGGPTENGGVEAQREQQPTPMDTTAQQKLPEQQDQPSMQQQQPADQTSMPPPAQPQTMTQAQMDTDLEAVLDDLNQSIG